VLFHHDVVAHGEPEPGPFAGRLRREERIENLLLDVRRNARPIVADADFNPVAQISCDRLQPRFKAPAGGGSALGCGVKPVRDQVQQDPRDLLRVDVGNSDGGIEIALERDVETLFLCAGAMVGKVEALVDDRVDLKGPVLARSQMQFVPQTWNESMSDVGQNRKSPMRAYVFRFAPESGRRATWSACPKKPRADIAPIKQRYSSGSLAAVGEAAVAIEFETKMRS